MLLISVSILEMRRMGRDDRRLWDILVQLICDMHFYGFETSSKYWQCERTIIARSASYVRGCRQTDVSVCVSVWIIIDFCHWYMNPGHVLEAIETLETWFLQNPRKVKLRLKAGLFGDPVLKFFLKNVAKTCQSWLSCHRPENDHQVSVEIVTYRQRILVAFSWSDNAGDSRIPALQGFV